MVLWIAIFAALIVTIVSARAQEGNLLPLSSKEPMNEMLHPSAEIRGALVMGLQVYRDLPDGADPDVRVKVPETWKAGEICVHVLSSDGLYEAINAHIVPDTAKGGVGRVQYITEYSDLLTDMRQGDLGLRITEKACGDESEDATRLTPAYWNSSADAGDLSLLLNTMRAEKTYLYVGGSSGTQVECRDTGRPARHAFDTICQFDRALLGPGDTELVILTVVDQQFQDPVSVTVVQPGEAP
ncbi:hypothetical protein [Roseovarius sp. Pro17]|uniref:hypothetical protein n=1 Tax=Roseovarius sp. Pro17 TaxID=3108175 RepID=UPI002D79C9D4|nr:hypothetical protein [Roseovarius sp. Pro17]